MGITVASIALGWTGEPALALLFQPAFEYLIPSGAQVAAHSCATAVAFSLITFMHVVFGELIPKSMALQAPDRTALWVAYPLIIFSRLSRPIVRVMNGTANYLLQGCGYRAASGEEMVHSVDELSLLVEDVEEAGMLDADQAEYVRNVVVGDACVDLHALRQRAQSRPENDANARYNLPATANGLDGILETLV